MQKQINLNINLSHETHRLNFVMIDVISDDFTNKVGIPVHTGVILKGTKKVKTIIILKIAIND